MRKKITIRVSVFSILNLILATIAISMVIMSVGIYTGIK